MKFGEIFYTYASENNNFLPLKCKQWWSYYTLWQCIHYTYIVFEVVVLLVVSVDKEKLKFATTMKAEMKKIHHTILAMNKWCCGRKTHFSRYRNNSTYKICFDCFSWGQQRQKFKLIKWNEMKYNNISTLSFVDWLSSDFKPSLWMNFKHFYIAAIRKYAW